MQCPKCNNSLDILLNAGAAVKSCPFCSTELDWETLTLTPENCLQKMAGKYGKEIFLPKNKDKLLAETSRWTFEKSKILRSLDLLNYCNVSTAIVKAADLSEEGRNGNLLECMTTLVNDFGLRTDRAYGMIKMLANALEMNFDAKQLKSVNPATEEDAEAFYETGTYIDTRDGQSYKTVKIGNQVWMAENLRYKTNGGVSVINGVYYYKAPDKYTDYRDYVAFAGWHIPTEEDWKTLFSYVCANIKEEQLKGNQPAASLCSKKMQNGIDVFGFNAIETGIGYCMDPFENAKSAMFWVDVVKNSQAVAVCLDAFRWELKSFGGNYYCPIRLVKD